MILGETFISEWVQTWSYMDLYWYRCYWTKVSSVFYIWTVWTFQLHQYIVGYGYDDWSISGLDRKIYLGILGTCVAFDYFLCTSSDSYSPIIDGQPVLRHQMGSDEVLLSY